MNRPTFLDSDAERYPELAAEEASRREADKPLGRHRALAGHLRRMRALWPEWRGPRVDPGRDGRCLVEAGQVWNETQGGWRCHRGAPCRVLSVSHDRESVTVAVESEGGAGPAAIRRPDEGDILRLDLTELWPPVWRLAPARVAGRESAGCLEPDALAA